MDNNNLHTLTVSAGDRRFSVKLTKPECHGWFCRIVKEMIEEDSSQDISDSILPKLSMEVAEKIVHEYESEYSKQTIDEKKKYKGFLYIKCGQCGNVRGFNSKEEISFYRCLNCNRTTNLIDLVPLYVKCECGRSFKYQTNVSDDVFDIPCLDCSAPVSVEFNKKENFYQTIR